MECICSRCLNLKGVIGEIEGEVQYSCEFGVPTKNCDDCEEDGCDAICDNYISDEQNVMEKTLNCKGCGKELHQVCSDDSEDVYCIDCYLNKK
jgi:hypothetical protein